MQFCEYSSNEVYASFVVWLTLSLIWRQNIQDRSGMAVIAAEVVLAVRVVTATTAVGLRDMWIKCCTYECKANYVLCKTCECLTVCLPVVASHNFANKHKHFVCCWFADNWLSAAAGVQDKNKGEAIKYKCKFNWIGLIVSCLFFGDIIRQKGECERQTNGIYERTAAAAN